MITRGKNWRKYRRIVRAIEVQTRICMETRTVSSCSSQHQEVVQLCSLEQRDRQGATERYGILAHRSLKLPEAYAQDVPGFHPAQLPPVGPFVPESIAERPL